MNRDLNKLQPYPFEKLKQLNAGIVAPDNKPSIALSIGEPQHPAPDFVIAELISRLDQLSCYPTTRGNTKLREAIAAWVTRRFNLPAGCVDPATNVLPVNGTREALFAFAQSVVDRCEHPVVIMPNPFYQIYEGAALLAGAEPWFLNLTDDKDFLATLEAVPKQIWQRCQLVYICSPGNPTGVVIDKPHLEKLIQLADEFNFIIAADECYSEIYPEQDQPPIGLLQVAAQMNRVDFKRCVVFHSLSKRSNLPGLRSGFVAGDAAILERFFQYRTYHGCAMSPPSQAASIKAWSDEQHVLQNRILYRQKFDAVLAIIAPALETDQPEGGFYLWPRTPIDDTAFAQRLFAQENVTVLPGSFLSREVKGENPGRNRVRIALVPTLEDCVEAAKRLRRFVDTL